MGLKISAIRGTGTATPLYERRRGRTDNRPKWWPLRRWVDINVWIRGRSQTMRSREFGLLIRIRINEPCMLVSSLITMRW